MTAIPEDPEKKADSWLNNVLEKHSTDHKVSTKTGTGRLGTPGKLLGNIKEEMLIRLWFFDSVFVETTAGTNALPLKKKQTSLFMFLPTADSISMLLSNQ